MKQETILINYLKSLGLEVHRNTQARGYQGFCMQNRIDISKNTSQERVIPVLLHEFAHYIHSNLEVDIAKNGGTLFVLFGSNDVEEELLRVTHFVDEHSKCERLLSHKKMVKNRIKELENIIKQDYPNFMRSKKFKEFDKYIRHSNAKYLLKHDRVKLVSRWLRKVEIYSLNDIEIDFPEMPRAFVAYLRLKSAQKKQTRITARINKMNKYYSKPTELFARFVEGIYVDEKTTRLLAPKTFSLFKEKLDNGDYNELKNVFNLLNI